MFVIPKISLLYAGILGLMYFLLSINVVRYRWKEKTSLGHNQNTESALFRAIRIHGNFAEYIPLLLVLFALDEMTVRSAAYLHAIGISLVLGRMLHFVGITKKAGPTLPRFLGTNLIFIPLIILSVSLILKGIS